MIQATSISTTTSERSTSSSSLASTPVTKRSKLSSRKNKSQSPGSAATNDQDKTSPFQSPVFFTGLSTPSQQERSPLSNSTIFSSLNSTPNRNWLSSQEPVRDILWDNTSPVNSRTLRGQSSKVLSNISDLCKNWSSDSHEEDGCASQKYGLSDKWLSVKNNIAKSAVIGAHLQQTRNENIQVTCNKDKQGHAPVRGGKPSKHLSSLLEIIKNPKVKGILKFEDPSSEDSTKAEVLVPNSDSVTTGGDSSTDELWGDDDNSFLLEASQLMDSLTNSASRTNSVTTIPATLSSTSSSSNKSTTLETNHFTKGASKNQNGSSSQLDDKNTNNTERSPVSPSRFSCAKFYDQSVKCNSNEYKSPLKSRPNFRAPKLLRRQNKGYPKVESKSVDENKDVRTLDEKELRVTSGQSQMGMPGVWMSQATCVSSSKKANRNVLEVKPSGSKQSHTNGVQLKKNIGDLAVVQNKSAKNFEMPRCTASTWNSQVEEDDVEDNEWGNVDSIFSQENIELLDSVIELEEKLFSQRNNHKNQDLNEVRTQENTSDGISCKKSTVTQESYVSGQSDVHSSKSNSEDLSKTSSQSDSYKKQYTRMEINRKKAEALRRRKFKAETQSKSNTKFCSKVYPT